MNALDLSDLRLQCVRQVDHNIEFITNAAEPLHVYLNQRYVGLGMPRIKTMLKNTGNHWRVDHEEDILMLQQFPSTLDFTVLNRMMKSELEMTLEGLLKLLPHKRRFTTARSRLFLRRILESMGRVTGINAYPEITPATPFSRPQFTGTRAFISQLRKNPSFTESLYDLIDEFWPTGWQINWGTHWGIEGSAVAYEHATDRANNPAHRQRWRSKERPPKKAPRISKQYADVLESAIFQELDSAHSLAHMVALLEKLREHALLLPMAKTTLIAHRHLHRPGTSI